MTLCCDAEWRHDDHQAESGPMGTAGAIAIAATAGVVLGAAMRALARRLVRDPDAVVLRPAVLAATTAALFAVTAWQVPDLITSALLAALVLGGVPLAAVDLAEERLPTLLIGILYAAVLVVITVDGLQRGDTTSALRAGIGMIAAFGSYLVVALVSGALGAGDVRLAGALGLALAWQGWPSLILGHLLGLALAAVAGLTVIVVRGGDRHTRFPLGPALLTGAFLAVLIHP